MKKHLPSPNWLKKAFGVNAGISDVKMRDCQDVPRFLRMFDRVQKRTAKSTLQLSIVATLLILLSGCSTLHTNQVELDPSTGVQRTTDIKIKNFWDSKSELAKMRASTTDKTQGMTIGGYNAETSATNAVTLFQFMMQGAFELGRKSVIPIP